VKEEIRCTGWGWGHVVQRISTNPMGIIGKYPNREVISPGFLTILHAGGIDTFDELALGSSGAPAIYITMFIDKVD